MKKVLFPLAVAALALGGLAALRPTADVKADSSVNGLTEGDDTPDFNDDFEDYETYDDLDSRWTNGYFAHTGDNNENCCQPGATDEDGNWLDRFKICDDPINAGHGKVLYYNTAAMYDSFTYLTIKGLMVKDFELTYDIYHNPEQDYGTNWFAVSCRKPVDGRYNGVSNVLLAQTWGGSMRCDFVPYRSVDSSFGAIADKYVTKGTIATSDPEAWMSMKVTCISSWDEEQGKTITTMSMYADGVLMGSCTVPQASSQCYGLISLMSCVSINYIDNIHVTNLDTEPYSAGDDEDYTPVVPTETLNYERGHDLEVSVDLKGKEIQSLKQATKLLTADTDYTVDTNKLVIKDSFLSTLSKGNKTFILTTEGGTASFTVKVPAADSGDSSSESSTPSGDSSSSSSESGTTKKGCSGSIAVTSGVLALLAGVGAALVLGKKKEDK